MWYGFQNAGGKSSSNNCAKIWAKSSGNWLGNGRATYWKATSCRTMLISIPPKYSVAQVVGYIKGKSAIHIARTFLGRKKNFTGSSFWARGYFVSTVGRDEEIVRQYIKKQESEDRRLDQLNMFE